MTITESLEIATKFLDDDRSYCTKEEREAMAAVMRYATQVRVSITQELLSRKPLDVVSKISIPRPRGFQEVK